MEKAVPIEVPISLVPMIAHGIRKEVIGNVKCSFNDEVIYPVEEVLVFHDMKTHKQRFMRFPEHTFPTMLAINTTRRLVAVVELTTLTTTASGFDTNIAVYDTATLKKRRNFRMPDEELEIEKLIFVHDSRGLIVLTKHPNEMLYLILFDKEGTMLEAQIGSPYQRIKATCIAGNPQDVNTVAVCGDGIVKVVCKNETGFSTVSSLRVNFCVKSLIWLSLHIMLLGLKRGKLALVENGEIKYKYNAIEVNTIDLINDQEVEKKGKIMSDFGMSSADVNCMSSRPKLFAYSVGNKVYLFEKVSKDIFQRKKIITLSMTFFPEILYKIMNLTIHSQREFVVVTADHCQIYECNLNDVEAAESRDLKFKPFGPLLHDDEIIDISVCAWKTIVMTASKDQTIRIWNYETTKVELFKKFQVDINVIELNSTGQFVAIAFEDQLRIMQIFVDDLNIIKTYNFTSCHSVKYSTLGHLMAAAYENLISITSVYNLELIRTLKGHIGNVLSLAWSRDDKYLISGGATGEIYQWDVETGQRVNEVVHKHSTYHSICCSGDPFSIYSLTASGYLKEIKDSDVTCQLKEPDGNVFTSLALSRSDQMMFASTDAGHLYNVRFPFINTRKNMFRNYRFFDRTITKILFSYDDTLLITGSKAGTLVVWVLQNIEGKCAPMSRGLLQGTDVLISRRYLKEMNEQIANLELRMLQQATEFEYQNSQDEMFGCRKFEGVHFIYRQAFETLKTRNINLIQKQTEDLNNITLEINALKDEQMKRFLRFSKRYVENMISSYNIHCDLNKLVNSIQNDYEEKLRNSAVTLQDTVEALEIQFKENLGKREDLIRGLLHAIQELKVKYAEYAEFGELPYKQAEIIRMVEHENIKKIEQQVEIMWRGKAIILKGRSDAIGNEADSLIEEVQSLHEARKNAHNTIEILSRRKEELENDLLDREFAIGCKEERIQEILHKNQRLEKYKQVLTHTILDLKVRIEPREQEINDIRNKTLERERILKSINKEHDVMKAELSRAEQKLAQVKEDLKKQRKLSISRRAKFERVCTDLYHITIHIDSPEKLIEGLRKLIEKYASGKELQKRLEQDFKVKEEFQRHKRVIEKSIHFYKEKFHDKMNKTNKPNQLRDNMNLLKEYDNMRKILLKDTKERNSILSRIVLPNPQSPLTKIKLLLTLELIEKCKENYEIQLDDLMEQRDELLLENKNLHREIDMSKTITK